MTMQGTIEANHVPKHSFEMIVTPGPAKAIVLTEMTGFDDETEDTTLPDRTRRSGGSSLAIEFTVKVPTHHTEDVAVMEEWREEAKGDVAPTYLRAVTIIKKDIAGNVAETINVPKAWVKTKTTQDQALSDPGDMLENEYLIVGDAPIAVPS